VEMVSRRSWYRMAWWEEGDSSSSSSRTGHKRKNQQRPQPQGQHLVVYWSPRSCPHRSQCSSMPRMQRRMDGGGGGVVTHQSHAEAGVLKPWVDGVNVPVHTGGGVGRSGEPVQCHNSRVTTAESQQQNHSSRVTAAESHWQQSHMVVVSCRVSQGAMVATAHISMMLVAHSMALTSKVLPTPMATASGPLGNPAP
jgi:hypothetical protein